jgi:RNA polymerase sigma factor (sigma-70 family)
MADYIEQLVHTYGDDLYRIAYLYTKNHEVAEEVVQDVFMKFYKNAIEIDERATIKTYLTRMTINRSYDYLRTIKYQTISFVDYVKRWGKTSEQKVLQKQESEWLLEQIKQLPVKYREVLVLYYYEDYTITEIASMINYPESTIKSRLQRARKQLKVQLPMEEWEVLRNETSL